jgi:hypothetical protein
MTEYTPKEIGTAIENLNSKKASGGDGIASEIIERAYKQFQVLLTHYTINA